jgi:hypothetical protein
MTRFTRFSGDFWGLERFQALRPVRAAGGLLRYRGLGVFDARVWGPNNDAVR